MTASKGKPSDPPSTNPSDIVKANIARQRQRSDDTREARSFEGARRAEVFATYRRFKESEIPITAPELARLAMAKKQAKALSEITDSDLDDMLQFIARCQWRIEATKHFWGGYAAAFYQEDLDEAEPTNVVKAIREEVKRLREEATGITLEANGTLDPQLPKPISFERSLVLLGIPERPQRKGETASASRTRRFYPIFSEWYIGANRLSHIYGGDQDAGITVSSARPLSSWTPPTEKEIRAAYEKRIKEGWPSGNVLEILSRYVEDWRKKNQTEVNTANAKRRTRKEKA